MSFNGIKRISTDQRNMLQWTKYLNMKNIKTVLDLTCGAGAESIYFLDIDSVQKVVGYEIDQARFNILRQNVNNLPRAKKVKMYIHNSDSIASFGQKFDLILFDPPWTFSSDEDYMQGKRNQFEQYQQKILTEYQQTGITKTDLQNPLKSVDLKLGKQLVIQQVIDKCVPNCKQMALKIPLNCIQSPYSNDYVPIKQQHSVIPIIYTGKIKYIVIIIKGEIE